MNKKFLMFIVSLGMSVVAIILQSVVMPLFFNNNYIFDISLVILVFYSINYGKFLGEGLGFTSGLILDSLSGVPLGLNTIVRLVMGFVLGFFEGKIFLDKIILPCVIVALCTIIKFILFYLVSLFYPVELHFSFFSLRYLIELGLNTLLTPFLFTLFNLINKLLNGK